MNTLRHYFISDDLDDLELLEEQLEARGVENPQIHVLSNDETGVANHVHLHAVMSLFKNDIIHSGEIGALLGLIGAGLVLGVAYVLGLTETNVGWMPFIFLAVIIFGFGTWEGGFIGFQKPNYHYGRFEGALNEGKHVFIVELDPDQEPILTELLQSHPTLEEKGTEMGRPHQFFVIRHWVFEFIDHNLFSRSQMREK